MLAGIPQSPSNYSPLINERLAKKRQKTVLNAMYKNGIIDYDNPDLEEPPNRDNMKPPFS